MQISSNNINLEVQEFGHKENIPLIMISGFGSQLCDWPINLINKMVDLIEKGNDLVIPSRFIEGGKMLGAKKMKKMVTIFGSYLIYYIAGIPFKDCTNAFKIFSKNLKKKSNLSQQKVLLLRLS